MPAANVIREFFGFLGLETDEASFERGEAAFESLKGTLKTASLAFAGVSAAIGFATHKVIQQSQQLGDWSDLTGASIENLGALQIAANATGADIGVLIRGTLGLSQQLAAIGRGDSKNAAKALKELGLSVKDLETKPAEEAFEALHLALADVEDIGKRTALAAEIVGPRFARALNTIDPRALKEAKEEALALGLVLSKEDTVAAKALHLQLTFLSATLQAFAYDVVRTLLPGMREVVKTLRSWFGVNRDVIRQKIGEVFRAIGDAMVWAARHAKLYLEAILDLVGGFDGLARIAKVAAALIGIQVVAQIGGAVIAFGRFVAALRTTSIWLSLMNAALFAQNLLIGGLAVAIVLIFDELFTRLKGGRGLIDDFLDPKKANPEDFFLVKAIRLAIKLVDDATKAVSALYTLAARGPKAFAQEVLISGDTPAEVLARQSKGLTVSGNPIGALIDAISGPIQRALAERIQSPHTVVSPEERARIARGLGASPIAGPGEARGLAPVTVAPLPAAPQPRFVGGLQQPGPNQVNVNAPITISGATDPAAVGAEVQRRLGEEVRQGAARLQGGGG